MCRSEYSFYPFFLRSLLLNVYLYSRVWHDRKEVDEYFRANAKLFDKQHFFRFLFAS